MSKPKLNAETKQVLADLENRLKQFIEVNNLYKEKQPVLVKEQNKALDSVLILINQIRDTGKIKRASYWEDEEGKERSIPDGLEEMVTENKWKPQEKLV